MSTTVFCLALALSGSARKAPAAATQPSPKPVPVYTNEDLDRVRPYRDQTGASSRPALVREPARREPVPSGAPRGEEAWRREAAAVRTRVAALEEQARRLREQIESTREHETRRPGKGRSDARSRWDANDAREQRLRETLARARALQADFEDRARREGALPGWLR